MLHRSRNDLKSWLKEQWIIPPEAHAEFVCAMEDILEVYQRPYDARRPLVCFDEGTKQLVQDARTPLPAVGSASTTSTNAMGQGICS